MHKVTEPDWLRRTSCEGRAFTEEASWRRELEPKQGEKGSP